MLVIRQGVFREQSMVTDRNTISGIMNIIRY